MRKLRVPRHVVTGVSPRGLHSRRLVPFAAVALALVLAPLSAGGSPTAAATLHKLPDFGKVEVALRNTGDTQLTGFRQILPDPFTITEVEADGATCELRAHHEEVACAGLSIAPGGTWRAVIRTPLVYSNEAGSDVTYFPGAGPSAFFVSDGSGIEAGPFEAAWDEHDASPPPLVALRVIGFRTEPARVLAGRSFSALLKLSTNDLDALRATGKIDCAIEVGARTLRPIFKRLSADSMAECRWKLPRTLRGKRLKGHVEVSQPGATVVKAFARKIG